MVGVEERAEWPGDERHTQDIYTKRFGNGRRSREGLPKERILWSVHFCQVSHEVVVGSVEVAWVLVEYVHESIVRLLQIESDLLLL